MVIDPGDEGDRILKALAGDGASPLRVQAILLTPAHFDHTLAAGYLQEKTGAPVFVGAKDKAMLSDPGWMKQFMPSDSRLLPTFVRSAKGITWLSEERPWKSAETPGHSPGA